jgi:hypothetical protein
MLVAERERRGRGRGSPDHQALGPIEPFVGVIDELGASRDELTAADRVAIGSSLVEHLVRSARNKGCTRVEVTEPLVSAEPALWKREGFASQGRLLGRGA